MENKNQENNANQGFFIMINDARKTQDNLRACLNKGFYGFLMKNIYDLENTRQLMTPFSVLADYACCKQGTHVFLFSKRTITYGGVVAKNNGDSPVFYLNGPTNLFGNKIDVERYVDLDNIYPNNLTDEEGIYEIEGRYGKQLKGIPFIIEFNNKTELSGKQIPVDELYFTLGKFNFPLPSNAIQGKGMCTLTPYETNTLLKLIYEKGKMIEPLKLTNPTTKIDHSKKTIFSNKLIIERFENKKWSVEAELEFLLLAIETKLNDILPEGKYVKTRQVPLCPFKPQNLDYADICLYDLENPIKEGSLPNIIIELKKDSADYNAYNQVNKYLRWLEQITTKSEFELINAYIIAKTFNSIDDRILNKKGISLKYKDKIKFYSLNNNKFLKMDKQQTLI